MELQTQPKKKTGIGRILLYVFIGIMGISVLSALFSDDDVPKTEVTEEVNENADEPEVISESDPEEEQLMTKLKAKAERDWPNDYITQKYWIDEQIESFRYMKTIADDEIKAKAQRDWPMDFITQKFWYNEQIEAKESLNTAN